jgi:hypothetical protein
MKSRKIIEDLLVQGKRYLKDKPENLEDKPGNHDFWCGYVCGLCDALYRLKPREE